ncbi:MAG: adenosylcobinamide-GDP ribazoletransferase [Rhodospirillales bacterium]
MTTLSNSSGFIAPTSLIERFWQNFCVAAAFLTILPLAPLPGSRSGLPADLGEPVPEDVADLSPPVEKPGFLARAAGLFPLIGVGIGTCAALALLASFHIGLHPLACALIALAVAALVSGALHEDGLADFFDGLGGGHTVEQRLTIMSDSRLGSFGALSLVFATIIRAAILSGLFSPDTAALALIAGATVSRATLPGLMRWLEPVRPGGLGAEAGRPEPTKIALAVLIALVTALLTVGFWGAMSALVAALVAAALVGFVARQKLGGQTGDVLGAAQVLAEIAVLAAIAATDQ